MMASFRPGAGCWKLVIEKQESPILHNPQSAISNPQSAIRNPQSAIRASPDAFVDKPETP
jgi:hypothetical protein